ncbi:hypothetical protein GCM10027436_71860 [Actinophytocola sediminis]
MQPPRGGLRTFGRPARVSLKSPECPIEDVERPKWGIQGIGVRGVVEALLCVRGVSRVRKALSGK